MALSEETRRANRELARKEAAAAPRLSDDAVTRLRTLLGPQTQEAARASTAARRSARSSRSPRVGDT